jgi:hypothetical protein
MSLDFEIGETAAPHPLYHYQPFQMDWLEKVVFKGQIRLSNPARFNDPWDCKPCFDTRLPKTREDQERVIQCFDRLLQEDSGNHPNDLVCWLRDQVRHNRQFLELKLLSVGQEIERTFLLEYRIYCLTRNPANILMWSHYGDCHKGVCLGFRTTNSLFGCAMKVQYKETYPLFDISLLNWTQALAALINKSRHWSYEEEYRIIAMNRKPDVAGVLYAKDDYLRVPPNALESIILGCQVPDSDAQKVGKMLAGLYGRNIAVIRAERVPNQYALRIPGLSA